jgi:hypothetical protein
MASYERLLIVRLCDLFNGDENGTISNINPHD